MYCSFIAGRPTKFIQAACVSSTVKGESDRERKLRVLHVMSMLGGYGQPDLCVLVSQHFIKADRLDLSSVLSSTNLPDLLFLLKADVASDITELL